MGSTSSTPAKTYRLLHAILATAVEDNLILKNPCSIKRAGQERPTERPVATLDQIEKIASVIDQRYKAMVLLATWTGMRFGELAGLTRANLDILHKRVKVLQQLQELNDGSRRLTQPKTSAGVRTIAIPPHLIPDLDDHVRGWALSGPDGLVFPAPDGTPLRRSNFNRRTWQPACQVAGLSGFRFHDLRHTGNTLAASTGASLKELMSRMGHSSPRAALIYQHATTDRDITIANALSEIATRARQSGESETFSRGPVTSTPSLADPATK
jgi:integrase